MNDRQQEVLTACREDCERLERLMRALLALSKIEAGESRPRLAPLRSGDLLTSVDASLRPQVEAKGLAFKTEAAPDLPHVLADTRASSEAGTQTPPSAPPPAPAAVPEIDHSALAQSRRPPPMAAPPRELLSTLRI